MRRKRGTKTLHVGCYDYKVTWTYGPQRPERRRVAVIFWREVLRAINEAHGSAEKELVPTEDVLDAVAIGTVAFVRDNPGAMRWFLDLVMRDPADGYEPGKRGRQI